MEIKNVKLSEITPYEKNPRNNDEAVSAVVASIRKFGFIGAIILNKDKVIINGHTRVKACKQLGMETIPAVIVDHLTPEQENALRIADNKTGEIAEWNEELLRAELKALQDAGFEVGELGFDDDELEKLLQGEDTVSLGETDPDEAPEVPEAAISRAGEVYVLGDHLLMCGDSTKSADVEKLVGEEEADLWLTDPPYNVAYEGSNGLTIQNDSMEDVKFREFLRSAFGCAEKVMKPGASFYIFHADSEGYNFRGACHDVGLRVRQCLVWKKNALVLGRQDYQWIHEPCQPAGTMVRTPEGEKRIELLNDHDRVVSFDQYHGSLTHLTDGCEIMTANRPYSGQMYTVSAGGKTTRATDNHLFTTRISANCRDKFCCFLARRGNWWAVGHADVYSDGCFDPAAILRRNGADELWILGLFDTPEEAASAAGAVRDRGIPMSGFGREDPETGLGGFTRKELIDVYSDMDLAALRDLAHAVLADWGRNPRFPLVDSGHPNKKFSRRVTSLVESCNLFPEVMELPLPAPVTGDTRRFAWMPVEAVSHAAFEGRVYSLAVKDFGHYVADGIITHNCLYGWKEGAGHEWYADRSQTTVMEFNKPKKNDVHPTMKPTEMLVYLLRNSSKKGDTVVDTFGGSGSTLIACEQTGRKCRTMELDPKYCDVIRRRWAEFVHGEGCDWAAKTPPVGAETAPEAGDSAQSGEDDAPVEVADDLPADTAPAEG